MSWKTYFNMIFTPDLSLNVETINRNWQAVDTALKDPETFNNISESLTRSLLDKKIDEIKFIKLILAITSLDKHTREYQKPLLFDVLLSCLNNSTEEEQQKIFETIYSSKEVSPILYGIVTSPSKHVTKFLDNMTQFSIRSTQSDYFMREMLYVHAQNIADFDRQVLSPVELMTKYTFFLFNLTTLQKVPTLLIDNELSPRIQRLITQIEEKIESLAEQIVMIASVNGVASRPNNSFSAQTTLAFNRAKQVANNTRERLRASTTSQQSSVTNVRNNFALYNIFRRTGMTNNTNIEMGGVSSNSNSTGNTTKLD